MAAAVTTGRTERSLRRNATVNIASTALRGLLAFATSIVVARSLTTSDRGTFSLITTTTMLLVMLAGLGAPAALTRERSRSDAPIEPLYRASWLIGVSVGLTASLTFCGVYIALQDRLFARVSAGEAFAIMLLVPPMLVLSLWSVVAYLDDRIVELAVASVAGGTLFMLAVSGLAASRPRVTSADVVLCWAVTSLVPVLMLLRRSRVRAPWETRHVAARVLRFAVRANVASIALILAWRLDVFFVTSIRGAAELGQYAVAVTLAEVMLAVASSLRIALTPRQGQHKDRHLLVVAIARVTRLSVTTGLIVTVTLAPLAGRLMETLYGPRYGPAAGALVWLLPGIVALVAQGPLIDFLLVEERVRAVTGATVVGLVVNIGLNLALLPHHDFRAAAAASTVSYVVSCTWCVLLFRRHTGTRLRHLLIATPADVRVALSGHGTTASVTAPGPLPPS